MSETIPSVPQSRVEQYLGTIIDQESAELPPVPQSRVEAYLDYIVKNAGRVKTMPTASSDNVGKIVQYTGTTTSTYTNGYFYQCVENEGTYSWVQKNVQPMGSVGGMEYKGSVATVADLPAAAAANKGWMYTVTANGHEYVSDGTQWIDLSADLANKEDKFRYSTMPTASADYSGKVVQYTGTTTADYTGGYFYECQESGGTYSWVQKNVQAGGGGGTDLDLSIVNGKLCVTYEEA